MVTVYVLLPFFGDSSTYLWLEPGATLVSSLIISPSRLILAVMLPVRVVPSMALVGALKLMSACLAPLSPAMTDRSVAAAGALADFPALMLMSSRWSQNFAASLTAWKPMYTLPSSVGAMS